MIVRDLISRLQGLPENTHQAVVIFGARRVGKTTLLRMLTAGRQTLWLNGDSQEDAEIVAFHSVSDVRNFLSQADTIVIDEAQRIPNIGLMLKMLVDENEISERKTQIFVTGSSSLDLMGGIQESAVGRLRRFYLWPFSLNELVRQYGTVETARMLPTRMIYGMYPAVVESKDDPRQILEDYCEGIVFKDIFSLTGIRKAKQFMDLVQMLAYRIGSEINYDSLARECGLSKHAVSDYIDLLEQCFIVKRCDSFAKNLDNELKKGKKVYFCDLGIRNYLIRNFAPLNAREDVGGIWENFAFIERAKYNNLHKPYAKTYFWRTTANTPKEIDFIEVEDGAIEAFECKYSDKAKATLPTSFQKAYKNSSFHIMNPKTIFDFCTEKQEKKA